MFSLEPFLECRYVALTIRGQSAVHLISTLATSKGTFHALWLVSILKQPNFTLKLLFADHNISSVGFWHLSSLPQIVGLGKLFLPAIAGRLVSVFWLALKK
jgi:hypothetical protein